MKRVPYILKSGIILFILGSFLFGSYQIFFLRLQIQEIQVSQAEINNNFMKMNNSKPTPFRENRKILSQEEVISIAFNDFKKTRGSTQNYQAFAVETNVIWKVIIERKGKPSVGGSAEYSIDKITGDIYSKQFSQ